MPTNAASGPTTAPPVPSDVATASTTHGKDNYGYTSFIDPAIAPTIDYNHGAVAEISDNVNIINCL